MIFPLSLIPYQKLIESTTLPTVLMLLNKGTTTLTQSKIGGFPYFPKDHPLNTPQVKYPLQINYTPWPKHPKTGRELLLLLQVNFEEMPPIPFFPTKGILQIFVNDRNWHHMEEDFVILYLAEVEKNEQLWFTDFGYVPTDFKLQEYSVGFIKEDEYMTPSDFRYETVYDKPGTEGKILKKELYQSAISEQKVMWIDYLNLTIHRHIKEAEPGFGRTKLGGYHYSQNNMDPRALIPGWEDSLLLAQFQNYDDLSWGDGGSAQFFILRDDLEQLRFDRVLFHWDST